MGTLPDVLDEYCDEATFLWLQRADAVEAPQYSPTQFADLDQRLEAQIDGLRVAGDDGWACAERLADHGGPEDVFPAALLALESPDGRFDDLLSRFDDAPEVLDGIVSALGWVSATHLVGRVRSYLQDGSPLKQRLGLAACGMHRRDPGPALDRLVDSPADSVRMRALRCAGELGRRDLLPRAREMLADPKPELRYWAAWCAVLLGDRQLGVETLTELAQSPGPRRLAALRLALLARPPAAGHAVLSSLKPAPDSARLRIQGAGWAGDPVACKPLLEQLDDTASARIAAEAFCLITGADFNLEQFETLPPDGYDEGPTEDPDDERVELPEDIALPWPDPDRMRAWWDRHGGGFTPGQRSFLGAAPNPPGCTQALRDAFQRQRVVAALHLALLQPGTQLFPTSAPAWRQQRLLAADDARQAQAPTPEGGRP